MMASGIAACFECTTSALDADELKTVEIGAHDRVQACKEKPTSDARLVIALEFLEGGEDADEGGLLPNEWDQCLRRYSFGNCCPMSLSSATTRQRNKGVRRTRRKTKGPPALRGRGPTVPARFWPSETRWELGS